MEWTDKKVIDFINQFDMLRGVHKKYEITESIRFFNTYGTLFHISKKKPLKIHSKTIETVICTYFNTTTEVIFSDYRGGDTIRYKQIFQYFLVNYTDISATQIAKMFNYGKSGHVTVLSNTKTIQNRFDTEKEIEKEVLEIYQILFDIAYS